VQLLLLEEAFVQLSKAAAMMAKKANLVGVVLSYSQWALVVASVLVLTLMILIMKIQMTRMSRTEDLMEAAVVVFLVKPCPVKPCLVLVVPPAEEQAVQTIARWLGDLQLQLMRPLGLTTTSRVRQRSNNHQKGQSLVSKHEPPVGNLQGNFTNLIATREVDSVTLACAFECIM
jgi:hypothetical protein